MFINPKVIAAALIFGAALAPAMADSYYGALDAGQSTTVACSGLASGVDGCNDTAKTLFRIAGGYQFTPEWGTEVSYADYGKASAGMILGTTVDWQISGFQLSGTGTFQLSDEFDLIAKLGIARTKLTLSGGVSATATSTKLASGIGAQYNFNKKYSARIQYEDLGLVGDKNTTGTTKVTLLTVGLVYKF
jgi:OOP family OmpA-OmpF porin